MTYLSNYTRPNIACVVGRLNRYTHNPNNTHWYAVVKLFKYLKDTINYNLCYSGILPVLEGFCDANWITDTMDTKLTNGYVFIDFILGGGAIFWKSTKQTCEAHSTIKAKFIALEKASAKAEWLRNLANIHLWSGPVQSVFILCDNHVAIARTKNSTYNGKNRHIRLIHNIVRRMLNSGIILLKFVKSKKNLTDPLIKPLNRKVVRDTSKRMRLIAQSWVDTMETQPMSLKIPWSRFKWVRTKS